MTAGICTDSSGPTGESGRPELPPDESDGARSPRGVRRALRAVARLRPEEFLSLVFFVPSTLVTLGVYLHVVDLNMAIPKRVTTGGIRLAVTAAAMFAFAWFVKKKPLWKQLGWIRDIVPFLFCIAVYTNLHDTIHFVNPNDIHDTLMAIDQAIFGVQPCVWAQRFYHPILTEIFSLAYMNYFAISVSAVVWLLVERRPKELRETLFGTILCFYIGYLLYILFPAAPPRLTQAHLFVRDFSGGVIAAAQAQLADVNPISSRAAFPSLHCAITLITLMYAYRFRKLLFAILIVPGITLVLATVYLRHHYVIDIFAGFALAIVVYPIAPKVDRAWTRFQEWSRSGRVTPASHRASR